MSIKKRRFKHVCPKNCFSSCTMISTVENGRVVELNGNSNHPYTKGKLCAKGFSLLEMNDHKERLKHPYYQEVKGSGKFKKITWEKAYELILSEMMSIYKRYESFRPLGFLQGTGNVGIHHYVTEQFFASIGDTTRLLDSTSSLTSNEAIKLYLGESGDPFTIKEASVIFLWGTNPAGSNVHLTPFLIEAKVRGTKIVVIDPLYTQSAELADLYIQPRPGTDRLLVHLLMKELIESGVIDGQSSLKEIIDFEPAGTTDYAEWLHSIDKSEYLSRCGVSSEAIALLGDWLENAGPVAHVVGNGMLRHGNGRENLLAIKALVRIHGNGGGLFLRQGAVKIFNNQLLNESIFFKGHSFDLNTLNEAAAVEPSLQMLWISCANPLTQAPNPRLLENLLQNIPFVVAVDHFLTPTAKMANLVLPTTTHFEEFDIVVNDWHKGMAYNEQAISPYHESRSEWYIMKELALRLEKALPGVSLFPVHSSEEEYLDAQFNDQVHEIYGVRKISDLRGRVGPVFPWQKSVEDKGNDFMVKRTDEALGRLVDSGENREDSTPLEGNLPTEEHPFWLITPHHPYRLNSQFHFLNLSDESEAYVGIHEEAAQELGILNGEIVRLFNDRDFLDIKAVYNTQVPKDILFIYEGWYPSADIIINRLINSKSLYNTFVGVEKLEQGDDSRLLKKYPYFRTNKAIFGKIIR